MWPTSKFKCPRCGNEISVNHIWGIKKEHFGDEERYSFRCDLCSLMQVVTKEELEANRIDGWRKYL